MGDKRARCAILALCGLPGSGKTSFATSIRILADTTRSELSRPECRYKVEVVTFDQWLHAELAVGQFSPDAWQRSRQAALTKILMLLEQAKDQPDGEYTLIAADDNNHLRSMRHELFRLARDHGAAFLQLYLPVSRHQALARNQRRKGVEAVPAEALLRMAEVLEPPQPERFSWEACTLILGQTADLNPSAGPVPARDPTPCMGLGAPTISRPQDGEPRESGASQAPQADAVSPQGQAGMVLPGAQLAQPAQCGDQGWERGQLCQQTAGQAGMGEEEGLHARDEAGGECASEDAEDGEGHVARRQVAWVCEELWRLWGAALPPPPSEEELRRQREQGQAANAASYLHGLDLKTRRAVAAAVATAAAADRAEVARRLNEQRRAMLQQARELLQPQWETHIREDVDWGSGVCGSEDNAVDGVGLEVALSRLKQLEEAMMRSAGL